MERILSVEEMRKSDAATIESGTPGRELMQRAAAGIYSAVCDSFRIKGPVAIVCGSKLSVNMVHIGVLALAICH